MGAGVQGCRGAGEKKRFIREQLILLAKTLPIYFFPSAPPLHALCPMPHALCPMPHAPCPMPHAPLNKHLLVFSLVARTAFLYLVLDTRLVEIRFGRVQFGDTLRNAHCGHRYQDKAQQP